MRLGVFGGAFDPLHIGHLVVADDAASALKLDRVIFIPAGNHPLKRAQIEAPGALRLEMVKAGIAGSELFVADDRELRRPGPSYTLDTLGELRAEYPEAELFLLVGADILGEIHEWHGAREIAETARIVILSRAELAGDPSPSIDLEYTRVEVTHLAISSSDVRRRVREGRPFRYQVPDPVYRIIVEHSLYREVELNQHNHD